MLPQLSTELDYFLRRQSPDIDVHRPDLKGPGEYPQKLQLTYPPSPYSPADSSASPSNSSVEHQYNVRETMYHDDYYTDSSSRPSPGATQRPQYASPSPLDSPPQTFTQPFSAPPSQQSFPDRFLPSRQASSFSFSNSHFNSSILDRRMSEPTTTTLPTHSPYASASAHTASASAATGGPSPYGNPRYANQMQHPGAYRHSHPSYQPQHHQPSGWTPATSNHSSNAPVTKFEDIPDDFSMQPLSNGVPMSYAPPPQEEPVSPSFSGSSTTSGGGPAGISPPTQAQPVLHNSRDRSRLSRTSSSPPHSPTLSPSHSTKSNQSRSNEREGASASGNKKTYSFIPLPGQVRKRPRRRYDEIERHYVCSWPGCTKAYGTLNHLNAHVVMQGHGGRRVPSEFKELRKQWRKQKKEDPQSQLSSSRSHPAHLQLPAAGLSAMGGGLSLPQQRTPSHRLSLPSLPSTHVHVHPDEYDYDYEYERQGQQHQQHQAFGTGRSGMGAGVGSGMGVGVGSSASTYPPPTPHGGAHGYAGMYGASGGNYAVSAAGEDMSVPSSSYSHHPLLVMAEDQQQQQLTGPGNPPRHGGYESPHGYAHAHQHQHQHPSTQQQQPMRPLHVPFSANPGSRYDASQGRDLYRVGGMMGGQGQGGGGGGGGRLPSDSTLLTPLPGYEPPKVEDEDEGYRGR